MSTWSHILVELPLKDLEKGMAEIKQHGNAGYQAIAYIPSPDSKYSGYVLMKKQE